MMVNKDAMWVLPGINIATCNCKKAYSDGIILDNVEEIHTGEKRR
ncbi:hypothetical protein SAMN04488689_10683 [Paenibacillus sp. cl6col]|nr:hypothetical protein SAMN04488689_10683 [Paenibacillus sp. cl6col]